MRVLWFTNTPSMASNYLNLKVSGGSWIRSLEAEITKIPSIQLGICFNFNDSSVKKFVVNNTSYFPVNIKSPKNKFKKFASRWKHSIQNENNIQDYLRIIEEFKPDIINIFGTENSFGLIISKTTVPCIIHIQGNLNICTLKYFSGLSQLDIIKYTKKWPLLRGYGFPHQYYRNKKAAVREREIFHNCKYFMGRTDWDRRISNVFSQNSKYFHCEEVMRPEFYLHEWKTQYRQDKYIILSVFRGNIYKGLETIFECNRIIKERTLKYKITWKIAGLEPNDEISYITQKKFNSKFNENGIHLLGILEEKDLIQEMLNADLFVHPSHIDNSPNTICEAMLVGMPIISTYAGGIPTILRNNCDSLLVQDGDPYSLSGAIFELMDNRDYAIELSNKARQRALRRHNPERIVNELINIYSSII